MNSTRPVVTRLLRAGGRAPGAPVASALFSEMAFANHLANIVEAYSLDDSPWVDAASSGGGGADERREPRFVFLSLSAQQSTNTSAEASLT